MRETTNDRPVRSGSGPRARGADRSSRRRRASRRRVRHGRRQPAGRRGTAPARGPRHRRRGHAAAPGLPGHRGRQRRQPRAGDARLRGERRLRRGRPAGRGLRARAPVLHVRGPGDRRAVPHGGRRRGDVGRLPGRVRARHPGRRRHRPDRAARRRARPGLHPGDVGRGRRERRGRADQPRLVPVRRQGAVRGAGRCGGRDPVQQHRRRAEPDPRRRERRVGPDGGHHAGRGPADPRRDRGRRGAGRDLRPADPRRGVRDVQRARPDAGRARPQRRHGRCAPRRRRGRPGHQRQRLRLRRDPRGRGPARSTAVRTSRTRSGSRGGAPRRSACVARPTT